MRGLLCGVALAGAAAMGSQDPSTTLRLVNHVQAIEVRFESGGIRVVPQGAGTAGWNWGLTLLGAGPVGSLAPVAPAEPMVTGNRVEHRHPGLVEWYVNEPRGVEHGFTLLEPPGGTPDRFELRLAMSGGLSPSIDTDANGLVLRDPAGATVLVYRDLLVLDATGRILPARMELPAADGGRVLRIEADVAGAAFPVVIDPLIATQVKKLTAADADVGDKFGGSVSVDGETAVVGAWRDGGVSQAFGSVYVFERNAGGVDNWGQVKKLTPSDVVLGDKFGVSVSIHGDTVAVGTNPSGGNGKAYVFERNAGGPGNWGQVKKLLASDGAANDKFGAVVSISGTWVVVAASGNDDAGSDSGSAYLFERDAGGLGNWGEFKKLTAADAATGDRFGSSVSLSGDKVAVGANGDDDKGSDAGAAYVFERGAGGADNWGQVKKLLAPDGAAFDQFGSLSIGTNTVVVGASGDNVAGLGTGSAHVFERDAGGAGNWGHVKKLIAADAAGSDAFGAAVSIDGNRIVIGATGDDDAGSSSGSAYVFERDAGGVGNWGQAKKLTAADAASIDFFGRSVSIRGDTVVVGADEDDTTVFDAGSAYVFGLGYVSVCGDGLQEIPEACDDGNTAGGDNCSADCRVAGTGVPGTTGSGVLLASAVGSGIDVSFAPACSATDHAAYWGRGPIGPGGLEWIGSACGLGTSGSASFDPGALLPGEWLYFVVVGYDADDEGGFGTDSLLAPRPEAVNVGGCDRPVGVSTCP